MKNFLTFSVLLVIATVTAFSQAVFKSGYIIKNSNDTVHGLIEYKGNKTNANVCIFKQDAESEPLSFAPNDIAGYRLEDSKYYVSKKVIVNEKEELVFLEYLINGIVDMYYYDDGVSEHFFVDGGDNRLVELKNNSPAEYYATYTKRVIPDAKQRIGVLKYVFRESPEISRRVETIELDRKALIDVARAYHEEVCADEACIIYEKKKPRGEYLKVGIVVGLSAVTLSVPEVIPNAYSYFTNSDFGVTFCPSAGFFVKLNLPDINANLFLQYQGTFSKLKFQTNNWYEMPLSNYERYDRISYSQSSFNSVAVLKYEFREGLKFRPNVHLGAFFNFAFMDNYSRSGTQYYPSGDVYAKYYGLEYPFYQRDYGPVAGLGFVAEISEKNAILVDLQYQRGFQISEILKANYFYLNVGFQF
ncbi:MAG: outer membrane beta-barrel protein [Bacteroidales bacterium]